MSFQNISLRYLFLSFFIVTICICVTGCPGKKKTKHTYGTSGAQEGQQNSEVFRQSLDVINQLENHFGQEALNQAMGRLDNWIATLPKDESWQESPYYVENEKNLLEIHQKMGDFLRGLKKAVNFSNAPESSVTADDLQRLADQAQTLIELLVKSYASLGVHQFIEIADFFGMYQQNFSNFATVARQQNLSSARITDYVKGLNIAQRPLVQTIGELEHYTLSVELFAEAFRGDSLSIRGVDGDHIKQAVWCRNISNWARGKSQFDLDRALQLFDWTIRNIMLKSRMEVPNGPPIPSMPQPAWQALIYGQGILEDWANVFVELLRQQRIDACVLGVITQSPEGIRQQIPWGVGVLINDELYIFFAELGMPLPDHDGLRLQPSQGLVFTKVATFSQLKKDPSLLNFSNRNSISLENAKQVIDNTVIFLPLHPIAHSMRMKILENELLGEDKLVLHTSPREYRERIQKVAGETPLFVWHYIYQGLFENCRTHNADDSQVSASHAIQNAAFQASIRNESHPLWKGRILYFANKISGEHGAVNYLQEARVTDRELSQLATVNPVEYIVYRFATVTASYWLGTIAYNAYNIDEFSTKDGSVASNYFQNSVLKDPSGAFWRNGAIYHLARIAEREGRYEDAIRLYSIDTQEVDFSGRQLRASILAQLAGLADTPETSPPESTPMPQE